MKIISINGLTSLQMRNKLKIIYGILFARYVKNLIKITNVSKIIYGNILRKYVVPYWTYTSIILFIEIWKHQYFNRYTLQFFIVTEITSLFFLNSVVLIYLVINFAFKYENHFSFSVNAWTI